MVSRGGGWLVGCLLMRGLGGGGGVCSKQQSYYFCSKQLLLRQQRRYSVNDTPPRTQMQLLMTAYLNMWNRSALVLQTEDLSGGGMRMLQAMAPRLFGFPRNKTTTTTGSGNDGGGHDDDDDDGNGGGGGGGGDTEAADTCQVEHDNASPDLDACGRLLDAEPDERTRELIIAHNQLDIVLYKASLRMYELQKQYLLLGEAAGDEEK